MWKLEAELVEPTTTLDRLGGEGRRETDASDASWSSATDPLARDAWRCLVVGDFPDPVAREAARIAIAASQPLAVQADGHALGCPQLHVDLGERDAGWYERGADEAEAVRAIMLEHGAATDFSTAQVRSM